MRQIFFMIVKVRNLLALVLIHDEFYRKSLVGGLDCDKFDKMSLYYGPDGPEIVL